MRPRISIRVLVRPWVHRSVGPLHIFFESRIIKRFKIKYDLFGKIQHKNIYNFSVQPIKLVLKVGCDDRADLEHFPNMSLTYIDVRNFIASFHSSSSSCSGTLSGGGGGGGGRELDFREKDKKTMQKENEFLLDGCPIPGNNPNHPRTR